MTGQDKVDSIMDNFNFERVHECMESMGWTWYREGEDYIPDISQLRKEARGLLKLVVGQPSDDGYVSACGGFVATYHHKLGRLALAFQVEEWDVCDTEAITP